ncbi:hypothetical protein VTO42DRAFT_4248 [Malbranchea cinnamomea]
MRVCSSPSGREQTYLKVPEEQYDQVRAKRRLNRNWTGGLGSVLAVDKVNQQHRRREPRVRDNRTQVLSP